MYIYLTQYFIQNKLIFICIALIVPDAHIAEWSNWLCIHHNPQNKLLEYWLKTAKNRLQYIYILRQPLLSDIFQQWPRYQNTDGYFLVIL